MKEKNISSRAKKRREHSERTVDVVERISLNDKGQVAMTSLMIAEITGRRHDNVLRDIREMEKDWHEVTASNFALVEYIDAKGEKRPYYLLTKEECLYIATKFNNKARAQLVMRWLELEKQAAGKRGIDIEDKIERTNILGRELAQEVAEGLHRPDYSVALNNNDLALYSYLRNAIATHVDVPFFTSDEKTAQVTGLTLDEVKSGWQRLVAAGYFVIKEDPRCGRVFVPGSRGQ